MFLLPLHNPATARIIEASTTCDIYEQLTINQQAQLMESFLRFIETWLNKIRRPNPLKHWVKKKYIFHDIYLCMNKNIFSI